MSSNRKLTFSDIVTYRKLIKRGDAVGIEIEWEFDNMPRANEFLRTSLKSSWVIKGDGSLRSGLELISSPIDNYGAILKDLQPIVDYRGIEIRISHRCSIHVHLNYQTRTPTDVMCFYALYAVLEPMLDSLAGNRSKNPYCIGIAEGMPSYIQMITALKRIEDTISIEGEIQGGYGNNWKYSSVNILPLSTLGTVEIRSHEGTTDIARIIKWIDVLTCMRTYSSNRDLNGFIEQLFITHPEELARIMGITFSQEFQETHRKALYRCRTLFQDYDKLYNIMRVVRKKVKQRIVPGNESNESPEVGF